MNTAGNQNQSADISICIPTYNQCDYIEDALRSAFAQSVPVREVIVCDDCSTDRTPEVVEKFRNSLPAKHQSVLEYYRNSSSLKIGGNFDRAVRLGQGKYCVKLDSDDVLEPDYVRVLVDMLEENPKAGWAHCNVLNISPEGYSLGVAHTRKKTNYYSAEREISNYFRRNDTCHCVVLRKSAYEEVGGYRPEMKTCEDWLLWLEMMMLGWGYCFNQQVLAKMRKYPSRPDLMSKRRMDFIESVNITIKILEDKRSNTKNLGQLSAQYDSLLRAFKHSVAKLCIGSGYDEHNVDVRRALFQEAYKIHPSLSNLLWKNLGVHVPPATIRMCLNVKRWPRTFARKAYWQLMKNNRVDA